MTGMGGAIVLPALIHFLGISPVPAVGTGLLYMGLTRISGSIVHYRHRNIRVRRAVYFLLGSVPTDIISARAVNYIFENYDRSTVNTYLQTAMGVTLLGVSFILILQLVLQAQPEAQPLFDPVTGKKLPLGLKKKLTATGAGVVTGMFIGATSIGSGTLIVPVLVLCLNTTAQQAVGTSIAISLFLSLIGSTMYIFDGNIVLWTAIAMSIASVPGVSIGCSIAERIPERVLRIIVVALVLGAGVAFFFE